MNSTPSTLARIMRFTALHPPPPTPMTLIFAPSRRSSLNDSLIHDSFGIILLPLCPPAARFRLLAGKHAFQFRHQCTGALRRHAASMHSVQQQPYNRCVLGLGKFFGHIFKPARRRAAYRQSEHSLRQFGQPFQTRTASREDKTRGHLRVHARTFQIVEYERKKFLRARLNDLVEHAYKHGAWRAIPHAGDLYRLIFGKQVAQNAAVFALNSLRFGNRCSQTDGQIIAEVIAANSNGAGMTDHSARVNDQLSSTAADVEQAAAQLAFILREDRFSRGQRLERSVADYYASTIDSGHN